MDKQTLNLLEKSLSKPLTTERQRITQTFMINSDFVGKQTPLRDQQEIVEEIDEPSQHISEIIANYMLTQTHIMQSMGSFTNKYKDATIFDRNLIYVYAYNEHPKVQISRSLWRKAQIMRYLVIEQMQRFEKEEIDSNLKDEVIRFVNQIQQQLRNNNSIATSIFNEDRELIIFRDKDQKMNPFEQIDRFFKAKEKEQKDQKGQLI